MGIFYIWLYLENNAFELKQGSLACSFWNFFTCTLKKVSHTGWTNSVKLTLQKSDT